MTVSQIQSLVFLGLDGVAKVFPAAALPIELLEKVVTEAEAAGFVELPMSEEQLIQAREQAAGAAARAASAVTSFRAHQK